MQLFPLLPVHGTGNNFSRQKESSCTFQQVDVGDNNLTSLFLPEFSPLLLER